MHAEQSVIAKIYIIDRLKVSQQETHQINWKLLYKFIIMTNIFTVFIKIQTAMTESGS